MSTELENQMGILEDEVNRRRRNDKLQKWGLFGLAMLLLITLTVIWWLLTKETNRADASGAQVVTEQAEKKDLAKEAQQALCGTKDTEIFDKDLCEKLAQVSQEPPAPLPETSGPSQAELILAFRAYCDAGNCKGEDGRTPDANDIAAAFVKFCSDGRCTGADGKPGEDGKPLAPEYEMVLAAVTQYCSDGRCTGRPGTDGADGANATQEMVLAAVQQVCANDACRGPAGAEGQGGPKGEPGRGIADAYCQDSGLWRITYTDGEVDTDGGKCRPEPTPAGPPTILPSLIP